MGFSNWLMKHGPTSVGKTTRFLERQFFELTHPPIALSMSDAMEEIYYYRYLAAIKIRNEAVLFDRIGPSVISDLTGGDFRLFAFIIQYLETKPFRNYISHVKNGLPEILQAIHEETEDTNREYLISLSWEEYIQRAREFVECNGKGLKSSM